jgi:hypothetical protein
MRRARALVVVAALAAGAAGAQDLAALAGERQRLARELLESEARGARFVELRVRHELGLKVEADAHWQLSEAERAPAPAEWQRQLDADAAAAGERPLLILGSTDHANVGRALFQAKRFEEARKELLLIPAEQARLVDLFLLARCHEQLGAAEDARQVYLAIEARDTRPGDAVGGSWAQAARSARRTMGWLQDRGAWKPAVTLESRPAHAAPARKP